MTLLFLCCKGSPPVVETTPAKHSVAARKKPDIQARLYGCSQSGNLQLFGVFFENNTRDTVHVVNGTLLLLEDNDTLATIIFRARNDSRQTTESVFIDKDDTVRSEDDFWLWPNEDKLETVMYSLRDTTRLDSRLAFMPNRFTCVWVGR